MFKNGMRPVHPGEVLLEDYIKPMGVSVRALSIALHVPYSRLRDCQFIDVFVTFLVHGTLSKYSK